MATRISTLIRDEHLKLLERSGAAGVERVRRKKLHELVRSEFDGLIKEAIEVSPQIESKLETVRKKLIESGKLSKNNRTLPTHLAGSRPEHRIALESVSRLIETPVNDLLLFFLNGNRIQENWDPPFDYRLGEVCFYGMETDEELR